MKTMGGSDKCKTHAEWLEELRNEAAELRANSFSYTADVLDGIVVNLEAAHNREFAEKIKSLAATMPDVIQPVIERAIRKALKVQEQMLELAGGDAAKLREALKPWIALAEWLLENAGKDGLGKVIQENGPVIRLRLEELRAVLAAPPRQCDVGTAEEQIERWGAFCNRYDDDCTGCPCDDAGCASRTECFANWAQMPCETKEGGAK